jgi:hypothetical protein
LSCKDLPVEIMLRLGNDPTPFVENRRSLFARRHDGKTDVHPHLSLLVRSMFDRDEPRALGRIAQRERRGKTGPIERLFAGRIP